MSDEKSEMETFLTTEACPDCIAMGFGRLDGTMLLTNQVYYSAPLQYEYLCSRCGHFGTVGYESMVDGSEIVVKWTGRR